MRPHLLNLPLLTAVAVFSTSCARTTLEERFAGQSQVRKIENPDGSASLELTGGVIHHSFLRLDKVKVDREEDNIYVIAKLTPITDDFPAKFNYREVIPVTTGSERVYFGSEKKQIWGKKQSPALIAKKTDDPPKEKAKLELVKPVVASRPKEKKPAQPQLARLERLVEPPRRQPKLAKVSPVPPKPQPAKLQAAPPKPQLDPEVIRQMQTRLATMAPAPAPIVKSSVKSTAISKPATRGSTRPQLILETVSAERKPAAPIAPKAKVDAYGTKYL